MGALEEEGWRRDAPPDLFLLPEGTVPLPLDGGVAALYREALEGLTASLGTHVAVGALGEGGIAEDAGEVADADSGNRLTNSVYFLDPAGAPAQRYDKARLVPAMEGGAYRSGPGGEVLTAGDWVYGPLVCYESLFGGLARRARLNGAQVLLNLSSDVWFGDGTTFMGALFLRQHPAHLVLRAVENRMPVARAANGGWTLFLDPRGLRSRAVGPQGGAISARLPVWEGTTLFSRTGDLVGPTAVLLCILLLTLPRRPRFGGVRAGEGAA
jgi:apolipoprotein N-acyltransferase